MGQERVSTGVEVVLARWTGSARLTAMSPVRLWVVWCALAVIGCARRGGIRPSDPELTIVVAATTDVHGRLRGWDYYANAPDTMRGLSRAATVVDSLRAAHSGRLVLVDAGDLLQGNPLTYVAARASQDALHPVIAAMNVMAYDAAAVGNHEFNYGLALLDRARREARFPLLAANVGRVDGGPAFPGWTMVERAGARVGIVGATTPGSMVWDRDALAGRATVGDIVPAVRAAVGDVRSKGADVVVVVLHSGLAEPSSYDTIQSGVASENVAARVAREVSGVDVVVFGHSHKEVADTSIAETLLIQPKNWATSVGLATLALRRLGGGDSRTRWAVVRKHGSILAAGGHREHPALLAATERAHAATVAYATSPIATTTAVWRSDSARVASTALMRFILQTMRNAAGSELAASAAFSVDAALGPGPITVADIARLYPYENTLRAVRLTGAQLREYLEWSARYFREVSHDSGSLLDPSVPGYNFDVVSGVSYTIDLSRPWGKRITRLERNGRAVAATDVFTLALSSYRQTGGGGYSMLRGAPVVYDRQQDIRTLLLDEVRRYGMCVTTADAGEEWHLEPAEARDRAYRAIRARPER
ncbi:MAG: 5'-nucleotidase C-terminal domain-containing protein [Gemmatimonadaceae bacterium]